VILIDNMIRLAGMSAAKLQWCMKYLQVAITSPLLVVSIVRTLQKRLL